MSCSPSHSQAGTRQRGNDVDIDTDDDDSAALHQLQLEHLQFWEEWHKEYEAWLDTLGVWWAEMDKDERWISDRLD
jgi:hypothetical protein